MWKRDIRKDAVMNKKTVGISAVACACLMMFAIALAGCSGFKAEEVSVGDCSVKFTEASWQDGHDWALKSDRSVFVLSGTLTNNGNEPVRPADHLVGQVYFSGANRTLSLKPHMPSGSDEVAPGESVEVQLYDSVDTGIKKSYFDGHDATVEWGWAEDLSGANLDDSKQHFDAFESLGDIHTISGGRV